MTSCGNYRQLSKQKSFSLENFPKLIDDSTGLPSKEIKLYKNRIYSPDKNYYLKTNKLFKNLSVKHSKIKNSITNKKICRVRINPFHDFIYWQKDAVFALDYQYFSLHSLTTIDLINLKKKRFKSKGYLSFVGADSLHTYFETDNRLILKNNKDSILFEHSIITFENGSLKAVELLKRTNYVDTNERFLFYTPTQKILSRQINDYKIHLLPLEIILHEENEKYIFKDSFILENIKYPILFNNQFYSIFLDIEQFKLVKFSKDSIFDVFNFKEVLGIDRIIDYNFVGKFLYFTYSPPISYEILKTKTKSQLKTEFQQRLAFYNLEIGELVHSRILR